MEGGGGGEGGEGAEGAKGHNWPRFDQATAGDESGEGEGEERVVWLVEFFFFFSVAGTLIPPFPPTPPPKLLPMLSGG